MLIRPLLIIAILLVTSCHVLAQSDNNAFELSAVRSLYFFSPDVKSLNDLHPLSGVSWGGEVAYKINMFNNHNDFVKELHLSSIDIVGGYRNYSAVSMDNVPGSEGFLGGSYTLLSRMNFDILTVGTTKLIFAPGFGFVYNTQTFYTNQNTIIGGHINFAAQAAVKLLTRISSNMAAEAGVDILHNSDGAYRVPNNGLNSYDLSLGIIRYLHQPGPVNNQTNIDSSHRGAIELGVDIGRRGVFETKKGLYKSSFLVGYGYKIFSILTIKAQFDAMYYFTVLNLSQYYATNEYYADSFARLRTGVSLGSDIWFGKFCVTANYGYYLHNYSDYPIKFYWIAGFRYYLSPIIALQAKSYIDKNSADYTGIGIVYKIPLK